MTERYFPGDVAETRDGRTVSVRHSNVRRKPIVIRFSDGTWTRASRSGRVRGKTVDDPRDLVCKIPPGDNVTVASEPVLPPAVAAQRCCYDITAHLPSRRISIFRATTLGASDPEHARPVVLLVDARYMALAAVFAEALDAC